MGTSSGDDAAVWRLSENRALVATVDFITPIVDDPFLWGQIAVTNAVSDIYAMGADPIFALNLVGWNSEELPEEILVELLRGATAKAEEANFIIAGGHSVEDQEPKYGMCVIGEVHPSKILTNTGLRDQDVLILTKPLGLGIITTAIKSQAASPEIYKNATDTMLQLNRHAKDVALRYGATGATDITGFGLLGHLLKMVKDSHLQAVVQPEKIPVLSGAYELAKAGSVPGGSLRNLKWVTPFVEPNGQSELDLTLLADAQTSGGLLFGVEPDKVDQAIADLNQLNVKASSIGRISRGPGVIKLDKGHLSRQSKE